MTPDSILKKLRSLCLGLPETKETLTWGHPNFRVGEKIFCSFSSGDYPEHPSISLKVGKDIQRVFLRDERFYKAPSVGQHGWVSLRCNAGPLHWDEVAELVQQSYRLIAPARLSKLLSTHP